MLSPTRLILISAVSLYIAVYADAQELLEIQDLDREVDLTSQLAKVTHSLTIKNVGKVQTQQYAVCFPADASAQLAFLEVVEGESDDAAPLPASPVILDTQPGNASCWGVHLSQALQPGATSELDVYAVFTKLQHAFPAHIQQAEPQRVLYQDSAYVLSPYSIATQTTKFKLPTRRLESWTKHAPSTHTGSLLKYGPYKQTPGFAATPLRLHYENNAPFAEVMKLEREIEVSHWGNVYVEERYELKHGGAKHQGVWSRLEYMQDPGRNGPASIRELVAHLPRSARWLYFKDDIGNVSTSAVRFGFDKVEALLHPRYPLFGGWKVQFTFGWSMPLRDFVARLSGSHMQLSLPLSSPLQGVIVDDLTVKVVLPEGASNIRPSTPFPMQTSGDGRKFSYLDTTGRPVLTLRKINLVPDHNKEFSVTYQMPLLAILWEPIYLTIAVMAAFGGVMAYVRCEFTISRDSKWLAEQAREKMVDLTSRLQALLAGRSAAIAILDDTDIASVDLARRTAEAALHESDAELKELQGEFTRLPGFKKGGEVASLLEAERALQGSALQLSHQRVSLLREGLSTMEISSRLERHEQGVAERQEDVAGQLEALTLIA
ncbi:hypothetical protein WJX74_006918 [Apatococcus lobatus]|uniref:Dolichyl-diphosphooligosaccharide--protein glycosyltransferase subunit 1 n=2 Tax=Apatococcus TaxID=904362 RepID=A0AAW1SNN2_9CHLO